MLKKRLLASALALVIALGIAGCKSGGGTSPGTQGNSSGTGGTSGGSADISAPSSWKPGSTVTIYVGAGAGGGTDLMVRAIAQAYEQYFGVTFQVVNAPGGGGGIAMQQVWDAKHDGYTLCGIHEGMHPLAVTDCFAETSEVWDIYMCAGSTPVLSVNKSSGIQDFKAFLEYAATKELNAGASTPTSVLGLSYAQLENLVKEDGITFNFLSYEGSNPTNVGLLSNETEFIITNYSEQIDYIASGDFVPLVAMSTSPVEDPVVGTIPSICDYYPEYADYQQLMQWWGIILPADCPDEVVQAYRGAWPEVMKSAPVQEFIAAQNISAYGYLGEEASELCKGLDAAFSYGLWDLGLAAHDPAEFGMER